LLLNHKDGLPCYLFANMAAHSEIRHAVFTRNGGCSQGPYGSLNVGYGIGDRPVAVEENRNRIAEHLEGSEHVFSDQVHGDDILIYRKDGCGANRKFYSRGAVGDAMVTDIPGLNLTIQVADCQAVILYDPVGAVVANVHSGWRGSINNIIGKTVAVMTLEFGCEPANLLAGVGPSLGPCCAEFVNYRDEIPARYWPYKDAQDHFDFWSMSRDQLCDAGVKEAGICISRICTKCNTDRFFSYRAQKVTGRFAVVASLT